MDILEKIIQQKHQEVAERKALYPVKLLEQSTYFPAKPVSMCHYLKREDKSGIIAEFKRKSPSKGMINAHAKVESVSIGYMQAGASALSILTDKTFFGGSNDDLQTARKFNYCPILRKDFIVDEYQLIESKAIGADTILLIAAVLEPAALQQLAKQAKSLGFEVLLEVHNAEELERNLIPEVDIIGVNNRDLKSFEVSIETSLQLLDKIPSNYVKLSESGLHKPESIIELKKAGFDGFLVGEAFMQYARPGKACADLIHELQKLSAKNVKV